MSKFTVGDIVKCVAGSESDTLKFGELYKISAIDDSFVGVDGKLDATWKEDRFELFIEEAPEKVMIDVEVLVKLLDFVDWTKRDIINYLNGYIDGAKGAAL